MRPLVRRRLQHLVRAGLMGVEPRLDLRDGRPAVPASYAQLRWEHVDLAKRLVLVEGAMDERGTLIAPKSRAGLRRVPVVAALREVLTEYRGEGAAEGFVFGPSPQRPFTPSAVCRRVRTSWRRAGLEPIGLHEARHTFASVLIAAGVNAKAITIYMGHSSVQATFDLYGKLMPGNEQEAVALVDTYLERADTRSRLKQLW